MKIISVIIPCLNEEENIEYLYEKLNKVSNDMKETKFEIIFIDDGSTDKSLNIIEKIYKKDKMIKFESFSRNFGKESAIYAGLKKATGDYAVIMDCDMQHDPELIKDMYYFITNENYDSVAIHRLIRKGSKIRRFFSQKFFKLMRKLTKMDFKNGEMDFRMMNKKMYQAVLGLSEYNRFSKGLFKWVGFNTKWIMSDVPERKYGQSKWNFKNLFNYAVEGIISFSVVPLVLSIIIGILFEFISFSMLIAIIIKIILGVAISNLLIILCIIFFVSGIQLIFIGIVGEYISKIYMESKDRPLYISKKNEEDIND